MNRLDKVYTVTDKHIKKIAIALLVGIIIAIVFAPKPKDEPKHNFMDVYDAKRQSENFVKNRLKSPSTAKFDDPCESCVVKQDDGTWVVNSYVDAQNSFGAMIRENYICKMSYDPNTDIVHCISVDLSEN